MRVSLLLSLLLAQEAIAGPGKPEVSIGFNSAAIHQQSPFAALEPHVEWQTSGSFSGCDVEVCQLSRRKKQKMRLTVLFHRVSLYVHSLYNRAAWN